MPFGFGSPKIKVTIVNATDGKIIAKSSQRPEDIPERFDVATTIHLGDKEFAVVEADYPYREAYTEVGQLTLKVQEIQYVDPKDILYSLPTIADCIASTVPADLTGKRVLEMHEDDWLQIELISKSLATVIEAEISSIEAIYRDKRASVGFYSIHVRSEIKCPLDKTQICLASLKSLLGAVEEFDGIRYHISSGPTSNELVKNGFAFAGVGGLIVYGQYNQNADETCTGIGIRSLNVQDTAKVCVALGNVLSEYNLVLVDWCGVSAVCTQNQIQQLLQLSAESP